MLVGGGACDALFYVLCVHLHTHVMLAGDEARARRQLNKQMIPYNQECRPKHPKLSPIFTDLGKLDALFERLAARQSVRNLAELPRNIDFESQIKSLVCVNVWWQAVCRHTVWSIGGLAERVTNVGTRVTSATTRHYSKSRLLCAPI